MRSLIFLLLLCMAWSIQAEEENYCHDEATNAEWQSLLAQDYSKDSIVVLFSLRDGLCRLVDAKVLSVQRATIIFETERDRVLIEALKHNKKFEDTPL